MNNVVELPKKETAQQEPISPPRRTFRLKTFLMVLLAKIGIKASHFIVAEVMDSKGRVGKVQFIFQCRPWLSRMHIDGINRLAAEQAVTMKMMKPSEVRQVTIILIAKMGME